MTTLPRVQSGPQAYLSFGGGVNSIALGLWLLDHGIRCEWVYADHGADWPETREYVRMLKERDYPVTILETGDLYGYYLGYRMVPMRMVRACTRKFKVEPLSEYFGESAVVFLGFSAEETRRVKDRDRGGLDYQYPLIDYGINRAGCRRIITDHNLPMPMRSGCFFCPHQKGSQWINLRTRHPELYCKAKRLEDVTNERLRSLGREPIYLADRPLDQVCMDGQPDLFGERSMEPCLCEL